MQQYFNDITPRQLQLIFGGLVMLIAVVLLTYMVMPQLKSYRAADKTRTVLERAVANKSELASQLESERAKVARLDKRLHGDMANLPARQMEAYIIGRLQKISWQHKVELVGVTPTTGEIIKTFQEILFNVDVSGDYFDLYSWLRELSRELGFVVIKQFEMSPIVQNKEHPLLRMKLTMASYRSI